MKLNRRWRGQSLQLATAGMIDIVFLLLIFFLVNSSFQPAERQIQSRLTDPRASASQSNDEPLLIDIQTRPALQFAVGGQRFSQPSALFQWLKDWPMKSQAVLVKAPAICPVEVPIRVLNDCRRAGFENVAYLPPTEEVR